MQETQETWAPFLGRDDLLEEGMATHSRLLAGKFHGQRSLAGYSSWGHKELDTTEWLSMHITGSSKSCCSVSTVSVCVYVFFFPLFSLHLSLTWKNLIRFFFSIILELFWYKESHSTFHFYHWSSGCNIVTEVALNTFKAICTPYLTVSQRYLSNTDVVATTPTYF